MNETYRQTQLAHIRAAIEHADRHHSPEECAEAEAALARPVVDPAPELDLRAAA